MGPPLPTPPEFLRVPPHTPVPRLIEMQANKGIKTIGDPTLNYWECRDSEYAVPAAGIQLPEGGSQLSSRVAMCDPPRLFTRELPRQVPSRPSIIVPVPVSRTLIVRPVSHLTVNVPKAGVLRPRPELLDFGSVRVNVRTVRSIIVVNAGAKPVHYIALQPLNRAFTVLATPGVVLPGLKVTLKVALESPKPQVASTSFRVTAKEASGNTVEIAVPLRATIVEPEQPPELVVKHPALDLEDS
jgi:hypothetical protein